MCANFGLRGAGRIVPESPPDGDSQRRPGLLRNVADSLPPEALMSWSVNIGLNCRHGDPHSHHLHPVPGWIFFAAISRKGPMPP